MFSKSFFPIFCCPDCPRSQQQFATRALSIFVTPPISPQHCIFLDLYQPDTLLRSRSFWDLMNFPPFFFFLSMLVSNFTFSVLSKKITHQTRESRASGEHQVIQMQLKSKTEHHWGFKIKMLLQIVATLVSVQLRRTIKSRTKSMVWWISCFQSFRGSINQPLISIDARL